MKWRAVCLFFALTTSCAWANIKQPQIVFLISNSNSMPMVELKRDQPVNGILKDIAIALAEQLKRDAQFRVLPRKRIEQEIQSGAADLYCYTNPAWLSADVLWSMPLIRNHDVVVTRADTEAPKQLSDLKQQTLGTVLGYRYPEIEKVLGADFQRDDGLTESHNMKKLLAHRHNYLLISELDFRYQRANNRLENQLNEKTLRFSSYDNYCALSRQSSISLNQLNSAIARLKKQKRINAIQAQYQ